jgi:hypothetical protein
MAGLGGEMVPLKEFYYMADILSEMIKDGKTKKTVYWVGFEAEA